MVPFLFVVGWLPSCGWWWLPPLCLVVMACLPLFLSVGGGGLIHVCGSDGSFGFCCGGTLLLDTGVAFIFFVGCGGGGVLLVVGGRGLSLFVRGGGCSLLWWWPPPCFVVAPSSFVVAPSLFVVVASTQATSKVKPSQAKTNQATMTMHKLHNQAIIGHRTAHYKILRLKP